MKPIHFVGAGPGAEDLITVRGSRLLSEADLIIYTGSLVNERLMDVAKPGCERRNSAVMALNEVLSEMIGAAKTGLSVVRLHTGDPSLYGAIREQMDALDRAGIPYDVTPGVSACFGAAASMGLEYTLPGVSQSLVITRMEGRTKVPVRERIESFAKTGASMAIYLSASLTKELEKRLLAGGCDPGTPAAIVYKATWPGERILRCTVGTIAETAAENDIRKTAVILVGEAVSPGAYELSKLYDPAFETEYRNRKDST